MQWVCDDYSVQGVYHHSNGTICQDHTLCTYTTHGALIAVSDGCSSGGATDIGARIVNCGVREGVRRLQNSDEVDDVAALVHNITDVQKEVMHSAQNLFGLADADMAATSLLAFVTSRCACVHVAGDGVVAYTLCDGTMQCERYIWRDNTPYYPMYAAGHHDAFCAVHGGDMNASVLQRETVVLDVDGTVLSHTMQDISLAQGMRGITTDFSAMHSDGTIRTIALFSDGVEQVGMCAWYDVVYQCMAYKQYKGAFVKRRMKRFVKDIRHAQQYPHDDLSCAAIHIVYTEVVS